jgi:hypothetical protein
LGWLSLSDFEAREERRTLILRDLHRSQALRWRTREAAAVLDSAAAGPGTKLAEADMVVVAKEGPAVG